MSCPAKDRNYAPCRFSPEDIYCKHHTYLNDYTDEMFKKTSVCSSCKLWKFTGNYATCEECRERGEKVRKEIKETIVLCAKDGCKFKKSENKYCGKHQANHFKDETEFMGLKTCKNYLRGCRSQNDMTYKFSACQNCLQREREKDHKRRGSISIEIKEDKKSCSVCCKIFSMDSFQGLHGQTKTCADCRAANKRADEKRDAEHVKELARKNEKKPERRAVKFAWKEANYEKVAKYWMDARMRLIENDLEGYLKKNAEHAKNWRDANPAKCEKLNKDRSENINYHFVTYKRSAEIKQLEFKLTKGDFMEMVECGCHYCGIIQEKGFNGIDRLDSSEGYIMTNCVSCCEMCNFMKGCLGPTIFINRIEHIMTHLGLFKGKLHPEDFKNTTHVEYGTYKFSANKRQHEFSISKSFFNEKIKESCYLCGKKSTDNHKNGLDRIDSNKGYIESNIKACCSNCNYIKRNNNYDEMIDKCMKICFKNRKTIKPKLVVKSKILLINDAKDTTIEKNEVIEENTLVNDIKLIQEKKSIVKGNKQTTEEKTEKARIRKQNQRERQKQIYGDEEYKKMKAKEIAEFRAKKKE
jgi:hypothetical protein